MPSLLIQFAYLQILDVLTTLAFLTIGIGEANPLVRFLVILTRSPLAGLLIVKLLAAGMALFCWRSRRHRLLSRVNIFYAVLVTWNLLAFLVGAAQGGAA